jgi:predicted MPP superfamily phosphohydrolase
VEEVSVRELVRRPFKITEIDFPVENLNPNLNGFLIVHLADLHTGVYTSSELLEKAFEFTANLKPNLILHTGDFVHSGRHDVRELLFKSFGHRATKFRQYKRLARIFAKELRGMMEDLNPSHGSYGVFGNHDYIEGVRTVKRYLFDRIKWLVNDSVVVPDTDGNITISGLDDFKYGKPSITETTKKLEDLEKVSSSYNILLNHNPDALFAKDNKHLSKYNLILGGHTHGGQVCLPGTIALTTQTKNRKFYRGLDKFSENTYVYTSRGVGCAGVPFRLFCDPEIVVIRLVGKRESF